LAKRPRALFLEATLVPLFFLVVIIGFLAHLGFEPSHQFIGDAREVVDWNGHFNNMWDHYQVLLGNEGPIHSILTFHPHGMPILTIHGDLAVTYLAALFALIVGIDWAHFLVAMFVILGNAAGGYLLVRLRANSIGNVNSRWPHFDPEFWPHPIA